jgi:hypothetical protein
LFVGAVATYNPFLPREQRVGPAWLTGGTVLVGPVLLALGGVSALLELAARRGSGRAKGAIVTGSRRWVLTTGLTMLLVGGFPGAYTPLIFGSQNEQAWGMVGTIIFLYIGLPGLAVTGIGVPRHWISRSKRSDAVFPDEP